MYLESGEPAATSDTSKAKRPAVVSKVCNSINHFVIRLIFFGFQMGALLAKSVGEKRRRRDGESESWSCMFDKGFQGIQNYDAVLPRKKPKGRDQSAQDLEHNQQVASDRIVIENFYGRLKRKFKMMTQRFSLNRDNCSNVFSLFFVL